jgi:HSP20 family protein
MYGYSHAGCDAYAQDFRHHRRKLHHYMHSFRRPKYNVPVNIIDYDTYYEVHVFATGFGKEDIKITIANDLLLISGKKALPEDSIPNFSMQEFPVKNFERVLSLEGKVDADNISAKQENQVLIITLPKTDEAKREEKVVEVQ